MATSPTASQSESGSPTCGNGLFLVQDHVVLAGEQVSRDVVDLELGGGGQDDVCEQAVVLEPRMLRDDELEVGVTQRACISLPPFQQVCQQGLSVQIMWISPQPGCGKSHSMNWSSAGMPAMTWPPDQ